MENKNIFENAKFGDEFQTRSGKIGKLWKNRTTYVILVFDELDEPIRYREDGKWEDNPDYENDLDIVSKVDSKSYKPQELMDFVHDHIQSKIDHNELGLIFKLSGTMNFEEQLELYNSTLFEGIVNGIFMTGGTVEGIK